MKDYSRRDILTLATVATSVVGLGYTAVPFISSWQPSAKARALGAPVDVDISTLESGKMTTVKWRGKPVWIVRRTQDMLTAIKNSDNLLRDPDSKESKQPEYCENKYRSVKDEYLILVGVCTHLGCSPIFKPTPKDKSVSDDWKGGFYCPCHGSYFDLAGRVYKSVPAPTNLEIPPHQFVSEKIIRIGDVV